MTAPFLKRLTAAATRGLRPGYTGGSGTNSAQAQKAASQLEDLGIQGIGIHSTPEEMADWEKSLWCDQDELVLEREKEWRQHLHYCANEQFIAYHKDRRQWIPRRTVPWRIRASYNVIQKCVNIRVSRLTENKPTVAVQAATADLADIEKAEYKQSLFWYLWEELKLHLMIVRARRWATKTGAGFLKVGWDPDAGPEQPVTMKQPRMESVLQPATDEQGQPVPGAPPVESQVATGVEELYLDKSGQPLGPVESFQQDAATGRSKKVRNPPPEGTDTYHDGEATVVVRSPFSIRYDRYVDDPADSWYVQDAEVLPASKILALIPDIGDALREAKVASEDDKAMQWSGLRPRSMATETDAGLSARSGDPGEGVHGKIDQEYLVRETWIFPKNDFLRKQWGKNGCLLVTVGGVLATKPRPLPEWALTSCPFIQFVDIVEEGNHYGKSSLRDVIPIQDDINRSRSMMAERSALLSRLLLGAPQNHGMSFRALAGMPGVMVTYRSAAHAPVPIQLGQAQPETEQFYESSLAAAQDLGNMNDASTGKIPSAGVAAKTVYALQYADERSIAETSTLQDLALKQLAKALDAVTRTEYTEARKIRIVGDDQSFLVERELLPEHLDSDVDYWFTPGSMLARSKEAVKNELLQLLDAGLVDQVTVKKYLATAVPEAYRESYNVQEAHARRMLNKIVNGDPAAPPQIQPQPWNDPAVHQRVLTDFMLTAKWEALSPQQQQALAQLWQVYALSASQAQAAQAGPATAAASAAASAAGGPSQPQPPIGQGPGAQFQGAQGAQQLEQQATQAQERTGPPGEAPQRQ